MKTGKFFYQNTIKIHKFWLNALLCIAEVLLSVYFNLLSLKQSSLVRTNQHSISKNLFLSIVFRTLNYSFLFALKCNVKSVVFESVRNASKSIFYEYVNLGKSKIQSLGSATILNFISRRSSSYGELIYCSIAHIAPRVIFISVFLYYLKSFLTNWEIIKLLAPLSFLASAVMYLQSKRKNIKKRLNHDFSNAESKRIDILNNYEKAIIYSTIDRDMEEYHKKLQIYTKNLNLYNLIYDASGLLISLFLSFFFYSSWIIINESAKVSSNDFSYLIFLSGYFQNSLYYLIRSIDTLTINALNFKYTGYVEEKRANGIEKSDIFSRVESRIDIENLCISVGSRLVITNLNLSVKKGQKIALFGPTGCGKSLLLSAIHSDVIYSGKIKIDGIDIQSSSKANLNKIISYISPDSKVFNRSVYDNLTLCNDTIDESEMYSICNRFKTTEVFKEIGFDKVVGKNGKFISGGQRQRIILLRSFFRDSDIFLIDTGFNGLDTNSELDFINGIKSELSDKIVFCVVNNVDHLKYFDYILLPDKNTFICDTYENLLAKSSKFKKLTKKLKKSNFFLKNKINSINLVIDQKAV